MTIAELVTLARQANGGVSLYRLAKDTGLDRAALRRMQLGRVPDRPSRLILGLLAAGVVTLNDLAPVAESVGGLDTVDLDP